MYPSNYPHAQKYVPAELHQNKEWRIVYYVHNPSTGKLHRKAIKCNRIGSKSTRLSYARRLCKEVNEKLASGWNPFYEQESSKGFTKLVDALQTFKEEKDRELRVDSVRCYKSFVSILKKWILKNCEKDMLCISFSKQHALNFLTNAYIQRKLSNRTYNNYVGFYTGLFNWMVNHEYLSFISSLLL